jgi:hypothetical protein
MTTCFRLNRHYHHPPIASWDLIGNEYQLIFQGDKTPCMTKPCHIIYQSWDLLEQKTSNLWNDGPQTSVAEFVPTGLPSANQYSGHCIYVLLVHLLACPHKLMDRITDYEVRTSTRVLNHTVYSRVWVRVGRRAHLMHWSADVTIAMLYLTHTSQFDNIRVADMKFKPNTESEPKSRAVLPAGRD